MTGRDEYMQIVAWRVKDFADGWILFHDEKRARHEARDTGQKVEALYRLMSKDELES